VKRVHLTPFAPLAPALLVALGLAAGTAAPLLAQPSPADRHTIIENSYRDMMNAAQAGDFAKARALCQQAIAWEPQVAKHRYNLACIEARAAEHERTLAFAALDQAVALGFANDGALAADPDLSSLRGDPRFARIVTATRRNAAAPAPAPAAPVAAAPAPAAPVAAVVTGPVVPAAPFVAPAPASYAGGRPVGLFFMTRYLATFHTLEKAAWYFAPDGTVYENLRTGFSPADLAAHTGRRGAATVREGKLSVAWAGGAPSVSPIEPDGETFAWDMGIFSPVKPLAAAAALAGVYDGGESLSAGGNRVAVAKRLELRADGTYVWEGASFVGGATDATKLGAGATGGSTGTWRVDPFALTLTDARSGTAFRAIAFPVDVGGTPDRPDHLFFAGILYKRN
jgi:hypothetical protein